MPEVRRNDAGVKTLLRMLLPVSDTVKSSALPKFDRLSTVPVITVYEVEEMVGQTIVWFWTETMTRRCP